MLVKDAEHDPVVEAVRLHLRAESMCERARATANIIEGKGKPDEPTLDQRAGARAKGAAWDQER